MRQVTFVVVFVLLGLCVARPGNIGAEIDELYSGMFRYVYKTLAVRHDKRNIVKMRRIDVCFRPQCNFYALLVYRQK